MKKLLCAMLVISIMLSMASLGYAEINVTAEELASATDEELENLRAAVVAEQKSRIISSVSLDKEAVTIKKGASEIREGNRYGSGCSRWHHSRETGVGIQR